MQFSGSMEGLAASLLANIYFGLIVFFRHPKYTTVQILWFIGGGAGWVGGGLTLEAVIALDSSLG